MRQPTSLVSWAESRGCELKENERERNQIGKAGRLIGREGSGLLPYTLAVV